MRKRWECRTCGTSRLYDASETPTRHPCGGLGSFLHNWQPKPKEKRKPYDPVARAKKMLGADLNFLGYNPNFGRHDDLKELVKDLVVVIEKERSQK